MSLLDDVYRAYKRAIVASDWLFYAHRGCYRSVHVP